MRLIAFLSQKGGSGKTTLAVHIAVAAQEAGEKVILFDNDPQSSASAWAHERHQRTQRDDSPTILMATPATLPTLLNNAQSSGVTLGIIDSPPHIAPGVDRIAAAADFLLIPCRPSAFDMVAIAASIQIARAAEKPNAIILNACDPRIPEVEDARKFLTGQGFSVAPVTIGQRVSFSRAIITGRSVTEFDPSGKAAEEITSLWKWIRKQIGGKNGR
jgi:chromosome partitioning protein